LTALQRNQWCARIRLICVSGTCLGLVVACAGSAPSVHPDYEKYSAIKCPTWIGRGITRSSGDLLIEGVVGIGETISDNTDKDGYREFIFDDEILVLKVMSGRAPSSKIIKARQRLLLQPQGDLAEGVPIPGNRKYTLLLSVKGGRYTVISAQECEIEG